MMPMAAPLTDVRLWLSGSGLEILLILLGAVLLTRFAKWLKTMITQRIDANDAESDVLVRSEAAKHRHALAQVLTWTVLVIVYCISGVQIAARLNVPTSSLVAPAAVVGVALGFGAQRLVQDLLAGFFIITERQYGFGDLISIAGPWVPEGVIGTVEEVTLRVTKIRTANGEVIFTSNGNIAQVTNLSRDWARVVVDVPVPVSVDIGQVGEILRQVGREAFADDELAFVAEVAPRVGRAVRTALLTHPVEQPAGRGPGLVLFDDAHQLVSANPEAAAWLEEVETLHQAFSTELGIPLPEAVLFAAIEARVLGSRADAPAATGVRTRVRTRGGSWLLVHASCLRQADGSLGQTAVVISPAKASEVAPLIVQAYELTPREVDVTRALARGLSTNEIAGELHLSRYTVQDHLKSVYEKTGVSTRGELVAKVFADHHKPGLDAAIDGSYARA